jgi:uncharacterized protein (TIGR02594 family)
MSRGNELIQEGLTSLGYKPGAIDGEFGPMTKAAAQAWMNARGQPAKAAAQARKVDLPWMAEAKRVLGRHEVRDNGWLRKWLRSDGKTLGDPAQLPWCGDFVETCLRLALPTEPFPGPLGQNPYWARNWRYLGQPTAPTYGAVLVFSRGSGGHVGFAVGEDATTFYVLGGNQSNAVTVARLSKERLLAAQWPATFPAAPIYLPGMTPGSTITTTNEV